MSDKHLGRIENNGESGKLQQFSQPWTPQMMTPKLDLSGAGSKMPSEFGDFQLVDNSANASGSELNQTRQLLKGSAVIKNNIEAAPAYESAYTQRARADYHHQPLHAGAFDQHLGGQRHDQQRQSSDVLTGSTTIPKSQTPDGIIPSETVNTNLPASAYREGANFSTILPIPAERNKSNYYNGLAEAHYDHGHLKGVPVHVVNGQVRSHLDHEVDIPLHRRNK